MCTPTIITDKYKNKHGYTLAFVEISHNCNSASNVGNEKYRFNKSFYDTCDTDPCRNIKQFHVFNVKQMEIFHKNFTYKNTHRNLTKS